MQALKGLVAGLAILIVIAMTTIAYGLYRKSEDPDFKFFSLGGDAPAADREAPAALPAPPPTAATAGPAAPRAFGEVLLSLPEGCSIATVSGDGLRIFLKLGPAGGACERVVVLDAASGARLGTLKTAP